MNEGTHALIASLFRFPGLVYGRPPHEAGCTCEHCFIFERVTGGASFVEASTEWRLKITGIVL